MDKDRLKECKDLMEEAEDIQKSLNLKSIDTAFLILIYETVDQIRFYNSE